MANTGFDATAVARSIDDFLNEHADVRNLIFGEEHGNNVNNVRLFQSPEIQAVMQKHGFHDMVMEARTEFQPFVEATAAHTVSPDDMAQKTTDLYSEAGLKDPAKNQSLYRARGELAARYAGFLHLHFVESQYDLPGYVGLMKRNAELKMKTARLVLGNMGFADKCRYAFNSVRYLIAQKQGKLDEQAKSVRKITAIFHQTALKTPEAARIQNEFWKERLGHDKDLADNIRAATQGRKTYGIYGHNHGTYDNDLDDHLGPGTARLSLCKNKVDMTIRSQCDYTQGKVPPAGYIDISTGAIVPGEAAYAEAQRQCPRPAGLPVLLHL